MATKKAAAKATAPKQAAKPAAESPAPEGAALLVTGGDFQPPPVDQAAAAAAVAASADAPKVDKLPAESPVREAAKDLLAIAIVCHEANRALCVAFGDDSQKPWAEAADWQRESAIKGVQFALQNPDADPAAQHAAWCRDKIAAGWGFGHTKDEAARTHPCLVAYELLPQMQKAKDHVFRAIVRAMTAG